MAGEFGNTYDLRGLAEDVENIIYNISPMDTVMFNTAKKKKASAVRHDWQVDTLASAVNTNAVIEGADATYGSVPPTTVLSNYCQISRKVVAVSGTQRKVDTAGRADEYSYQIAKRGRELKRDMERALTQNQASSAGGAGTARSLGSLESWLATNKTSAGTGTAQTTAGFGSGVVAAPVDSTVAGTFTKAQLDHVIQACWNQGGDPKVIMVGPHNRTLISGFSGISTLQTDANASGNVTLMGAIDFYKSNFGTLKVMANRFQRDRTAFVLDMEYFALGTLRDMQTAPLAKTGDSDRAMLLCEYTLVVKNQAASGKITDLTTS
jgi:hypothetical protein